MKDIVLIPPNLQELGVRRLVEPEADLITVWKTPYPVLTNYKLLCADMGIPPFAGETYLNQGPSNLIGYITSGYRTNIGSEKSAHKYALAIDVMALDMDVQVKMVRLGEKYFTRLGLYPNMGIVHLDLMPEIWIKKYNAARYWVCLKYQGEKIYHYFGDLESAIKFAA